MRKTVLCYGDSNTWGFIPVTGLRYEEGARWTGVAAARLGGDYHLIEDGISGRTTVWDDPFEGFRNGLDGLGYSLHRAKPLDLAVVMLGSNDLKFTDAFGYYKGLAAVAHRILHADAYYPDRAGVFRARPRLLLVAPIALHPDIAVLRPEVPLSPKYQDSCRFASYTEQLAGELGVDWMDAGRYAKASALDGLHMDEANHRALGEAVAEKIRTIL